LRAQHLASYVRGSRFLSVAKLDHIFEYYIDGILIEDDRYLRKILAEDPKESLRLIHRFLLEEDSKVEEAMRIEENNLAKRLAKIQKENQTPP
jgi:hypothetical protein